MFDTVAMSHLTVAAPVDRMADVLQPAPTLVAFSTSLTPSKTA